MTVKLPDHIHIETLSTTDTVHTGETVSRTIVWADRVTDRCPGCGQYVPVDPGCPVTLGTDGSIQVWSQQHTCGTWVHLIWGEVEATGPDGVTDQDIADAADDALTMRYEEIQRLNKETRERLTTALRDALRRLNDQTDDADEDDITTGSDGDPGVWRNSGTWEAWDYGADEEIITVHETEVEL